MNGGWLACAYADPSSTGFSLFLSTAEEHLISPQDHWPIHTASDADTLVQKHRGKAFFSMFGKAPALEPNDDHRARCRGTTAFKNVGKDNGALRDCLAAPAKAKRIIKRTITRTIRSSSMIFSWIARCQCGVALPLTSRLT